MATNYDETVSDPKFFDSYQTKKSDLEKLMEEWETVQEQIDILNWWKNISFNATHSHILYILSITITLLLLSVI